MRELKEEIGALQQKCMVYEDELYSVRELESQKARFKERETDLLGRERVLKEAESRAEEQKQSSYEREHQIL